MALFDTIKKSGVKEEAGDYQVSSELYEALDERVKEILDKAKDRADANRRNTLKPEDV